MAFTATCAQRDIAGNERNAKEILDAKVNKAKGELLKLKHSYDTALEDIQKHFLNASTVLTYIREEANKALDTGMLEFQRRLRKQLEQMEDLKKELSLSLNDKMDTGSHSDSDSIGITSSYDQILSSVLQVHVETVPSIRFLSNEAFLFRVLNGNFLPYFGCITLDNNVQASDLHLRRVMDSDGQGYTYFIDVPEGITEIENLKSRIKCEVFQTGTSVLLTPVWVADHFEIRCDFWKNTAFTVGVYLLDQHIAGSPAFDNPDDDFMKTNSFDTKEMEVVKPSSKRRIGASDPVHLGIGASDPIVEAALHEINNSDTDNHHTKTDLLCGRTLKISKKTKLPCFPASNSLKPLCELSEVLPKKGVTSTEESGVCRPHPNKFNKSKFSRILAQLTKNPRRESADTLDGIAEFRGGNEVACFKEETCLPEEKLIQQQSTDGHFPESVMVKTMEFNTVEAHLIYTTYIRNQCGLNRPVGVLEHSSGNIIVSDTFNDRLLRLNMDGGPINVVGPAMGFRRPSSLVELRDGSFAVICSNFIAVFDAEGNYMKTIGKNLLQKPYGLCLAEDGKLMTVETAYHDCLVIITICPELELEVSRVRVQLNLTSSQLELSKPRFIASYKGKLYVGDLGLDCVYEINYTTGSLLHTFGSTGTAPGCMVDPSGIVCDSDGNIFVADSRNHRIQVFDSCRRIICTIDTDYPLNRPSGIWLGCSDHMFVLNYWDNSLAKYHLKFKFI